MVSPFVPYCPPARANTTWPGRAVERPEVFVLDPAEALTEVASPSAVIAMTPATDLHATAPPSYREECRVYADTDPSVNGTLAWASVPE
jgi:hypothetical protein